MQSSINPLTKISRFNDDCHERNLNKNDNANKEDKDLIEQWSKLELQKLSNHQSGN